MAESNEALAAETLKGDLDAFEELVQRFQQQVFRVAYRMVGQKEEAEDIGQEVFLNVYQKMYQYDVSKPFAPWLYRITVNTCISWLRRKKKVVLLNFDDAATRHIEYEHTEYIDPLVSLEQEELARQIKDTVDRLPEAYRTVLILRYQLDLTNQEIADTLGITRANVEVKVHRARRMLRNLLVQSGQEGGKVDELQAGK